MKNSIIATLLVQSASAFNFNFGMCGWSMPEAETDSNFSMNQFSGNWYEVQRDSSLKDWACVTQEVNYNGDLRWPLTIYHYVNGNKVIEPEMGNIQ